MMEINGCPIKCDDDVIEALEDGADAESVIVALRGYGERIFGMIAHALVGAWQSSEINKLRFELQQGKGGTMSDEQIPEAAPDGFVNPVTIHERSALGGNKPHSFPGAMLSDMFAAAALTGLLSSGKNLELPIELAARAFAIADAMLIVRRDRAMMLIAAEQRANGEEQ